MKFTITEFDQIRQEAKSHYETIKAVYCPYFKEEIHFNAKGLDHLVFKKWNNTRLMQDQFMRFKYLPYAPGVLSNSKTLQGLKMLNALERVKRNSKWQQIMKPVMYYEFIAVVETPAGKSRIKIIVKQIENNEKFFYSIIPFWGTNEETREKLLFSGNPESD